MKYIATFISVLVVAFTLTQSVVAEEGTQIKINASTFIYTNDVMLEFDVENYLVDNYNELVPFTKTLTHWSGYSSISPKILITLIVMQNSTNGNYIGLDSNSPFGVLSNNIGFTKQTEDVSRRLSKAYYSAKQAGVSNPAGIAIQALLSQYDQDSQQFSTLLNQLFPETLISPQTDSRHVGSAPPANFLQLPYPVGETWRSGGTHTSSGSCGQSSYPACVTNAVFSSLDFQKRFGGWGIDTSDTFISAAHGGRVVYNSTCSIEIISPSGWSTSYYHLDNIQVVQGQIVSRNTPIAIYANNRSQALCQGGSSSGPHLHFSLKKNGEFIPLNNVSLSGYSVHAGRWDYDTDINYYWLTVDGAKHAAWDPLFNPGISSNNPTPTPSDDPAQLSFNGPSITISQSTVAAENQYYVDVPVGATSLTVQMSGGSGDADLYVRYGQEATTSVYDCRPFEDGNNEICQFDNPSAGRWYVMVRAYNPYSGASLSTTVETESTPPPTNNPSQLSSNGQSITISQPLSDAENRYYVDVPAGAISLSVQMNGGSGDADLYVHFDQEPTTADYDCRPFQDGNNETCQFNHPSAGRWYVMVRAYNPYSGVALSAKVNTGSNPPTSPSTQIVDACQQGQTPVENIRLTAGNAVCLTDISDGGQRQMSFHVSDENVGKTLEIILSHGSGNGDLLHRYDSRPTRTVYDNISNNPGNEERILVHNVQRSWNYIHIRANPAFSGVTLLPRYIGN